MQTNQKIHDAADQVGPNPVLLLQAHLRTTSICNELLISYRSITASSMSAPGMEAAMAVILAVIMKMPVFEIRRLLRLTE